MKLRDYKKNLKNEYQNTFKEKKLKHEFHFKLRYAFLTAFGVLFVALLIEHIWVFNYNKGVEKHNQAISNRVELANSSELYTIDNPKEYNQVVSTYKNKYVYQREKTSILTNLFTFQFIGCSSSNDKNAASDVFGPTINETGNSSNNSYQTNIQVNGIDEADVAKCDGKYIYYIYSYYLYIYEIKNETIITNVSDEGFELYIYDNQIISVGNKKTTLYELNQNILEVKEQITYERYLTSRLIENKLYLAYANYANEKNISYEKCYYDTCSNPSYLYCLSCIDLDKKDHKETQLLSSYETILYASNKSFYFASNNSTFTSISIFNYDLEPVGVACVNGVVLNQFSMDEYDGNFRVVSTDTTKNAEELNAITIFRQSDLEKIGYLNQGIGKERQTVKSVRFDGDTCYVVTYENTDPLYEIDCSNPENPVIVSAYEAPGYSNYLHTFKIKDKEYVVGLGFTDSRVSTKISVYEKTEGTSQIGKDFILAYSEFYSKADYYNSLIDLGMFSNHKALFIYNDESFLYLGAMVAYDAYLIFKIDVESENIVTIYKEFKLQAEKFNFSRVFLVDNKIYLTECDKVIVDNFS
ncbi:MAG: beta-propeller domain-containing protein [Anaeroplasma bactoclasticum]|nr:beta-propeller domain-containing protein [Anaeroplasma bactoclasticum]